MWGQKNCPIKMGQEFSCGTTQICPYIPRTHSNRLTRGNVAPTAPIRLSSQIGFSVCPHKSIHICITCRIFTAGGSLKGTDKYYYSCSSVFTNTLYHLSENLSSTFSKRNAFLSINWNLSAAVLTRDEFQKLPHWKRF